MPLSGHGPAPAALLATWVTSREGLERYARGALPVTDDRPRIEYATWVRRGEFARVLPEVLALRTEPPLLNASGPLQADVSRETNNLFGFYESALHAYRREKDLWWSSLKPVMENDSANPYYQWFLKSAPE